MSYDSGISWVEGMVQDGIRSIDLWAGMGS